MQRPMGLECGRCVVLTLDTPARTLTMDGARAVTLMARSKVKIADAARRLGSETVSGLIEAGFPGHFVPRRWGGGEGTFSALVRAAELVGEGCASTAWCAALFAAHGRLAAYFPERAQRELWELGPETCIAAAVMPPAGRAEQVAGGWRLTGEWSRASGIDFADWVLVASDVPGAGVHLFLLPVSDCVVVDTWNTLGMRGTGSNSVRLGQVFVPEWRSMPRSRLLDADPAAPRCHGVPYPLVAGLMFAAPVVGTARGTLASWIEAHRYAPGAAVLPAASGALSRASGEIHLATELLRIAATRADHGPVTPLAVAENQRDAALAVELCVTAVDRLFQAHGGRSIRDDDLVQQGWRDIRAAATHGAVQFGPAAAAYGAAVLA